MSAEEKETTQKNNLKRLVDIQFSPAGKFYSFDANDLDISMHELIVVEGEKGPIIGKATTPVYEKKTSDVATNIKKVVRLANDEDIKRYEQNREEAMSAFKLCKRKIVDHGLSMKLVDVDILTGDSKAIFYFTAEERVDFRALVKDLASTLHKRIEMRQIGARDATKCIGGVGSCGLHCCCEGYLHEFKSISIQMAKNQGLSPNPAKLTGMCGKLKCCLIYENKTYSELKKKLPGVGAKVETRSGRGTVSNLDIPRKLVFVKLEETGKEIRYPANDIKVIKKKRDSKRKKGEKGK